MKDKQDEEEKEKMEEEAKNRQEEEGDEDEDEEDFDEESFDLPEDMEMVSKKNFQAKSAHVSFISHSIQVSNVQMKPFLIIFLALGKQIMCSCNQ